MSASNRDALNSRYTSVESNNENVERTCAELRVYSGDMHPRSVTTLLGIQPTSTVAVGERGRINSIGRAPVGKVNGWFLSSEEHVQSKDLRDHLNWLINRLRPIQEGLQQLQATDGIRMYVSCPWWSRYRGGGPSLWPEQMEGLARLNLECTIDFADYSDETRGPLDAGPNPK